jgi:hypothetical protein
MDTCTVESGLFKKKPCGKVAVTRCANCEQALCATHAVAQLSETGKKSGKFVCHDCEVVLRENKKTLASVAKDKDLKDISGKLQMRKAAPAAAPAKPAPAADKKPGANDGAIEFTPDKNKK